jgi:hypothetical protein
VSVTEETIDATLDSTGQLRLSHQPRLPPGPVRVTIRAIPAPRRGLADVLREIAAEQRLRGFAGRSAADLRAEENSQLAEDAERDQELEGARRPASGGAVSAVLPGHRDRHLRRRGQSRRPAAGDQSPRRARTGRAPVRRQLADVDGMSGTGVWAG